MNYVIRSFTKYFRDISSVNPGQLAAIKRIGTREGLEQVKKWIEQADENKDAKRLTNLLAQLYHVTFHSCIP